MVEKHVIMVASENAALRGGKAGGVGDVLLELPNALAQLGWKCTVIVPSYCFLHEKNPSTYMGQIHFPFRNHRHTADFFEASSPQAHPSVRIVLVQHPWLNGEPIYFNDPSDQPFARDASKFALFCSAVGQYLRTPGMEGVLHLHDWHTGTLMFLRDVHPEFQHLKNYKTIFTVHNLGIQGSRPMRNHESSLEAWFPETFHNLYWVYDWKDPRYDHWFFTPIAAGIRCAHRVNTVSETYAREILQSSHHENGYFGGEGLEGMLQRAQIEGRLTGILNGCSYSEKKRKPLAFRALLEVISDEVEKGNVQLGGLSFQDSLNKLGWLKDQPTDVLLTSVTRVTEQKVRLFCEKDSYGRMAIDSIMGALNEKNGMFIMLGSGTPDYEWYLSEASRYHQRFLFVRGYSDTIANTLYASGTMFLMPSSYEPCGISQMIAMREGQPCIVHGVGGLKDTVWHDVNGFVFEGWTMKEKVDNFAGTVRYAVELAVHHKEKWGQISEAAKAAHFSWETAARKYEQLYLH